MAILLLRAALRGGQMKVHRLRIAHRLVESCAFALLPRRARKGSVTDEGRP